MDKMFNDNPSGAGVAWREKGKVKWVKGLEIDDAKELIAKIPMPFVAHFRIPSCGGSNPHLCHPFPVDKTASLALEGTTGGYVLFHNGHWGPWQSTMMESVVRGNVKLPVGKWSDSRAMALLAAYHGLGFLEFINEKIFVFGPDDHEIFGSGWCKVDDIWVSNRFWENKGYMNNYRRGGNGNHGNFQRGRSGGSGTADDKKEGDSASSYHTTPPRSLLPAGSGSEETSTEGDQKKVQSPSANNTGSSTGNGSRSSTQGSGGTATDIPFEEAIHLYEAHRMSWKQFKKARKRYVRQVSRGKIKPLDPSILGKWA